MTVVLAVHVVLRRIWLHKFKLLLLVYLFIVWFYYLFFKNSPLLLDTIRTTCSLEDDISFLADLVSTCDISILVCVCVCVCIK